MASVALFLGEPKSVKGLFDLGHRTVNPLAYAFTGSNRVLLTTFKPALIKVLMAFPFLERFSIVLYRADTIRPKSVHKLSTDLYGFGGQPIEANSGETQNGGIDPRSRIRSSGTQKTTSGPLSLTTGLH